MPWDCSEGLTTFPLWLNNGASVGNRVRAELPGVRDHDDVTNIIGVDIALSDEALRPHVATVTFGGNHILSS